MSYHPKVHLLDRSVWVLSGYIIEQDGSRTDILELAYHKHIAEFFYKNWLSGFKENAHLKLEEVFPLYDRRLDE
jgi:hypothetical protein